jgi:hypothetical protein
MLIFTKQGFKNLKQAIEETDKSRSGFIDSEVLHSNITAYYIIHIT